MRPGSGSLQARHALVIALVLIASVAMGGRFAFSVALGGGMQLMNLWWLERSVRAWIAQAHAGHVGSVSGQAMARLLLLLSAVGGVLLLAPVDPVPFTLGLSTAVPTVLWHGLATARREV